MPDSAFLRTLFRHSHLLRICNTKEHGGLESVNIVMFSSLFLIFLTQKISIHEDNNELIKFSLCCALEYPGNLMTVLCEHVSKTYTSEKFWTFYVPLLLTAETRIEIEGTVTLV